MPGVPIPCIYGEFMGYGVGENFGD
jgi:hypothetical protein